MRAAIGVFVAGWVAGWIAVPLAAHADDAPAGDQVIEPHDATRGGVNRPALPGERGREGSPGINQLSLWQAAREALRDRVLIAWLFGTTLCHLLDEILIVFASIYVRDALGASPAAQSAMVGAFIAGGALGLIGLDRLLARHGEHRLLIAAGVACAALFAGWLAAPSAWLAIVLMVPVGATAAPLYPLASALAYARCPERSSIVLVASHLFAPLALALPYGLGWVADHAGVPAALALLAAQPVGLVVLAAVTSPRRTAAPPVTTADRDSRDSRTGDAP
jgi:MFS family permease